MALTSDKKHTEAASKASSALLTVHCKQQEMHFSVLGSIFFYSKGVGSPKPIRRTIG